MACGVAIAFVVLSGAALLFRSFAALLSEDPGFKMKGLLAVEVPMSSSRYNWYGTAKFFNERLKPALQSLPGVEAVATANCAPLSLGSAEHSRYATRFGVEGRTFKAGRYPVALIRCVSPDYFRVLGITLKWGRWLTEGDRDKARYLINETLARRFFPLVAIAGVVGDIREMGLDVEIAPTGDPRQLVAPVRNAIRRADPEIAVPRAELLSQYEAASLARRRCALTLVASFGMLAAILTAAGIYGLLAYSVSGRTREFGIRSALGATRGHVIRLTLREAELVIIPGLAVGLAASLAFGGVIRSLLYRLSPMDPVSLVCVAVFLCGVSLLSVWVPAKRAAGVQPGSALQAE